MLEVGWHLITIYTAYVIFKKNPKLKSLFGHQYRRQLITHPQMWISFKDEFREPDLWQMIDIRFGL
jgi:hypothetical protein